MSSQMDACDAQGAAQELAIARAAEQDGDVDHAAFHVAGALVDDLLSPEARAMALRLDAVKPGVFPSNGFVGTVAAATLVAAARGDVAEALDWTAQMAGVMPDLPWDVWLVEQLNQASAAGVPAPRRLAQLALTLGKHTVGLLHLQPGEQRAFVRYADALFLATRSNTADATLKAAVSALARRAGQHQRAVELAEGAHRAAPNESTPLIMLGLAKRAMGQTDEALAAFRRAGVVDRDPRAYDAERARCLLDGHRFQEALDVLEHLKSKDTDAELRLLRAFCVARGARVRREPPGLLRRWLTPRGRDPDAVEQVLRQLAQSVSFVGDAPTSDTARRLALGHGRSLGVSEATVNVLRQVPRSTTPTAVELTVSNLEAPSSQLCLALHLGHLDVGALPITVERVPRPDPRRVDEGGYALWAFDGTQPLPAVAPPPPAVRDAVESVFADDAELWWPTWRRRAERHSGLDPHAVAACMVHPSLPPATGDVVQHVAFTQLAAAAILSTSERGRALLLALVGGPVDWVTVAAATGLVEACLQGDLDVGLVARRLRRLVDERLHDATCCLVEPLRVLLPRVPFVRDDTLAKLASQADADPRA